MPSISAATIRVNCGRVCVGSLYDFDKYGIPDAAVEKMQGIISDDDFQPEKLAPVSKAAAALSIWCKWRQSPGLRCSETVRLLYDRVRTGDAMCQYHAMGQRVGPKRARLEEATRRLDEAEAALNGA